MSANQIIEVLGGRSQVKQLTGLTRGRIHQWATDNKIPTPWLKFFRAQFPDKDWDSLLADSGHPELATPHQEEQA